MRAVLLRPVFSGHSPVVNAVGEKSSAPLSEWERKIDRVLALVNELCNDVPGGLTIHVTILPSE